MSDFNANLARYIMLSKWERDVRTALIVLAVLLVIAFIGEQVNGSAPIIRAAQTEKQGG